VNVLAGPDEPVDAVRARATRVAALLREGPDALAGSTA